MRNINSNKTKASKVAKMAQSSAKQKKDGMMDIKKFKKRLKKLSKKTGVALTMPVIPVIEDYRPLYAKIVRNVMDNLAQDILREQEVKKHFKYIEKYAKNIVVIDKKGITTLDEAEKVIDMAYNSIDKYMEERYGL